MRVLCCLSLVVLFLASGVPIYAQNAPGTEAAPAESDPGTAEPGVPLTLFTFNMGLPFTLNCTLKHVSDGIEYQWKKNGTAVEELSDLKDRYTIEKSGAFQLKGRSTEDDFGNYTCGVRGSGDETGWQVQASAHAKLPDDVNVVEGQKLKLQCRVVGKPYPAVTWTYTNASAGNATDVSVALGDRVRVARSEQGVAGAELVVEAVQRGDAGVYACVPAGGVADSAMLRVKDKYAALWPFLGICAEVFVLCAIILVYEKRRTKPDNDDSDTENHDQKKS